MLLQIFRRSAPLHELPFFLMTRGICLTYLLLASAIVFVLAGRDQWLAGWYASYLRSTAHILFGISLIGPLLLEDVLRRTL